MEKVLELVFKKSDGNKKVLSVNIPKNDVTVVEANAAMNKIITADAFATGDVKLTEVIEARMRTTDVEILAQRMESVLNAVTNYGFPMILSWYLLIKMEAKLDKLAESIEQLTVSISKDKQK